MTQVAPERPSEGPSDPFWSAYALYLEHMNPRGTPGKLPCFACLSADSVGEGCDEGRRLWGEYRLARIGER